MTGPIQTEAPGTGSFDLVAVTGADHRTAAPEGTLRRSAGGLAAILAPEGRTAPRDRLAALSTALARQRWIEALLPGGPVLALPAPTPTEPGEAEAALLRQQGQIAAALAAVAGRRQYQLSVSWDQGRVLEAFRDSPELRPLFAARTTAPAALSAAVDRLARRLRQQIEALAAPVAADLAELPRDDTMLAHLALLCEDAGEARLDAALEAIDALWSAGFRVRLVGPTAPVSFLHLRAEMLDEGAAARAARRLGTARDAGPAAIEAARKTLLRRIPGEAGPIRAAAETLAAAGPAPLDRARLRLVCIDGGRSGARGAAAGTESCVA